MQKYILIIFWLVLILLSCEKQDKIDNPIDDNDTIPSNDTIINLYDNSFFPLDTNDLWLYTTTTCYYDDIIDSIDESYCKTKLDTIIPSHNIFKGCFVTRRFDQNYFNTQSNKLSLIIDTNRVFKKQYVIDMLYTEINDTCWTDTVQHAFLGECVIEFFQSKTLNETTEEINLTINQGYLIGLKDNYVFQKNKGIIRSSLNGINMESITILKEYKNN